MAVVIAGVIVRISVRDEVPYLATLYYATPLALLVVGSVTALWLLRGRCAALTRNALVALTVGCTVAFAMIHYYTPAHAEPVPSTTESDHGNGGRNRHDGRLRVAFWNVARGRMGWNAVFATISQFDADVIGLVECTMPADALADRLRREFPEHEVARFHHSMILLSRYPIVSFENRLCEAEPNASGRPIAHFGIAHVSRGDNELSFVVADIDSHPLRFRKRPLESLLGIGTELRDQPTVVMGDFNTPTDSVWVSPFRTDFINTFARAGRGIDCTWPVPLPVMAIDQMWASRRWTIQTAELGWTWVSDHRPIISELVLADTNDPSDTESSKP